MSFVNLQMNFIYFPAVFWSIFGASTKFFQMLSISIFWIRILIFCKDSITCIIDIFNDFVV